jgi:hypothetical protein
MPHRPSHKPRGFRSDPTSRNWSLRYANKRNLRLFRYTRHYLRGRILAPTQWTRVHNAWIIAKEKSERTRYPGY